MKLPDPFAVPELRAGELHLSGYTASDAEWVARLAGPLDVARSTGLPHPMTVETARDWITSRHLDGVIAGTTFGWVARIDGEPIGAGSLRLRPDEGIGRLGFWLGQAYWGRGHGRTLARAVTDYAFDVIEVRRMEADCVATNIGSSKVLESCGFQVEGRLRGGFHRFDGPQDVIIYGALRNERPGFGAGMPSA